MSYGKQKRIYGEQGGSGGEILKLLPLRRVHGAMETRVGGLQKQFHKADPLKSYPRGVLYPRYSDSFLAQYAYLDVRLGGAVREFYVLSVRR